MLWSSQGLSLWASVFTWPRPASRDPGHLGLGAQATPCDRIYPSAPAGPCPHRRPHSERRMAGLDLIFGGAQFPGKVSALLSEAPGPGLRRL